MPTKEQLTRIIEQQIPFHAHLQVELISVDGHSCVLRFPHQETITGPSWHAGLINAGISAAGGALAMMHIDLAADRISTLNTRADFLLANRAEALFFEASLVKAGKTIIQTQVQVK